MTNARNILTIALATAALGLMTAVAITFGTRPMLIRFRLLPIRLPPTYLPDLPHSLSGYAPVHHVFHFPTN